MKKFLDFRNFLKNTSGNVVSTTAILAIPLMLSAGAAIDYSQFARKKSSLQTVTDSAALAVAPQLQLKTKAEIEDLVDDFMKSNLSAEQYSELQKITVTIPPTRTSVKVEAQGKHPTTLMQLAGINTLTYTPESIVTAPVGNAEVILVLDTTESMSADGKIESLKTSANDFIEKILASNDVTERVKVGIVPFARYVNVGLDNRNAKWLSVPDDYEETKTVETEDTISKSGCKDETYTNSEGIKHTHEKCDKYEKGPKYEKEITTEYKWRGCVGSRNYPRNLNDESYNHKVPGLLNEWCPRRITQLTSDSDVLMDEINALYPSGTTYIPTGLVWGLRAISAGQPFDDGLSYAQAKKKDVNKIIILMTDGENSSSINPNKKTKHDGSDTKQANAYMSEVCNNIKNEDIKMFTIGFGTDISAETLSLLKQCSSDGENYYNAKDGVALADAFSAITSKITELYLSK